jgi:hypothetical protein
VVFLWLVVDYWLTLNWRYTPMGITPVYAYASAPALRSVRWRLLAASLDKREAGIQVSPPGGSAHGSAGEHERIECFHRLALVVGE